MKACLVTAGLSFALATALVLPAAAQEEAAATTAERRTLPMNTTIYPSAEETRPLEAGRPVPHPISLQNKEGERVILRDVVTSSDNATVLVFYRGGWCPYCTTQLAELAQLHGTLAEHGVDIIGISPDTPEKISGYADEEELPYTILSDSSAQVMTAFGIAFAVDTETVEMLRGYGMDLAEWSGNPRNILPVPAVYVVDAEGMITFAYANPDYSVRLDGEELLGALGIEAPE